MCRVASPRCQKGNARLQEGYGLAADTRPALPQRMGQGLRIVCAHIRRHRDDDRLVGKESTDMHGHDGSERGALLHATCYARNLGIMQYLDAAADMLRSYFEPGAPPVSAPSCWFSNSTNCCSRSISIINGTRSTRQVVAVIHPAFPVDFTNFQATVRAFARLSCRPPVPLPWMAFAFAIFSEWQSFGLQRVVAWLSLEQQRGCERWGQRHQGFR